MISRFPPKVARVPQAALAACLALAACARNDAKSGAPSAESHAPGTTAAAVAGACTEYPKGSPGVINTFCDGPAVVTLRVGTKDYTLRGGSCATQGGQFSLNLGVVATGELAGPKPDYVGLTTPGTQGPFTNGVLILIVGGKAYPLTTNSGELTAAGGRFDGEAINGAKVSGSFTC